MLFKLINPQVRQRCIDYINSAPDGMLVEIKEDTLTRSKKQNSFYWKWMTILGNHFGYTKEEMHEELVVHFLGVTKRKTRKGIEVVKPVSTSSLTTKEFTQYLEKIIALAGKEGVQLPTQEYTGVYYD